MINKKHIYIPLFVLVAFIQTGWAQTYTVTDNNFQTCLKTRYPSTINSSNVIQNTEAEKINSLLCPNYKIKNVEGLQAFKNIQTLNLTNNEITELPALENLTKLTYIEVSSNLLESFPNVSKSKSLKEIYAQRNNIRFIPNLNQNDSLLTFYFHTNQLDTLPDLSNLKKLEKFNVAHNNLKRLPDLSNLTALKIFYVWSNQLTEIPSLTNLTLLDDVNIAYNKLTKLPVLSSTNSVTLFYANDNLLSEIENFQSNGAIQNVRLYNNKLSFKELHKLKSTANYQTIFKIAKQFPFQIGKMIFIKEKDDLQLSTGIDQNVEGVSYNWFKNGNFIKTSSTDNFSIPKIEFTDKGFYHCEIKSSYFPNVTLTTDSFSVNVTTCLKPEEITVFTTEKKCFEGARINIKTDELIASYELKSVHTNKSISNQIGDFKGLTDLLYTLKLTTPTGCQILYPNEIKIETEICDEVVISPNGDGFNDSYFFNEKGHVDIYDRRGNLIQSLQTPANWDGSTKYGKVSSGFYMVDINKGEKQLGITIMY